MTFAMKAEPPPVSELFTDVYAGRDDDASTIAVRPKRAPAGGTTEQLGVAQAVNRALDRALARDESVVLLGEDIADPAGGVFGVTSGLSTKYGTDRVRATPIAETSIVGAALGAAMAGMRPVAEIMFMDFMGVCLDQIANHVAKIRYLSGGRRSAPLTIRTVVGAGAGPQHSQSFEAWLMHTPGLKVVWPSSPADAAGLLTSCIDDPDPCVFVESMALLFGGGRGPVPVDDFSIPLGLADVKRAGGDVTIVSYGPMVGEALAAAEAVAAADGVQTEVVDLRSLVPLDLQTVLESVAKTKRLVVAHGATAFCGAGAEIGFAVGHELFGELAAPICRVGAAYTPLPHANALLAEAMPNAASLEAALRSVTR